MFIKGVNMSIILKNKNNFSIIQIDNVTNIAYNAGTKIYTITAGGSSTTYSSDSYYLTIFLI